MGLSEERRKAAERILKLLALAEGTTFAAEAKTARKLAEQLRAMHGITADETSKQRDQRDQREYRTYAPFAKGARWEAIIANALANLCQCALVFPHEYSPEYRRPENNNTPVILRDFTLIGLPPDLDMLLFMLPELHRQRMQAWITYKASHGPDSFHKFCYGFAKALDKRIDHLLDLRTVSQHHRSLIDWYEAQVGHKINQVDLARGRASSASGDEAGRNASLHRGSLSGGTQRRIGSS